LKNEFHIIELIRRIGMNSAVAKIGAMIAGISVIGFALCMLFDFDFGSYLV
jgi:hypothetical protein